MGEFCWLRRTICQNILDDRCTAVYSRPMAFLSLVRCLVIFAMLASAWDQARAAAPVLKVSSNKHFLVYEDGRPFFYLGDTAWELFHRLNREDTTAYLDNRASKGFTVIQAVAIAEFDGDTVPNAYGHLPLTDRDPAQPAVKDGADNDYWDHVDFIVNQAASRGLFIGFLPTWGRYWHDNLKDGKPLFTEANAEFYGEWLGRRYKDKPIIWILGGDRNLENDNQKAIIRAMARGLRKGDEGHHLITLHPNGGATRPTRITSANRSNRLSMANLFMKAIRFRLTRRTWDIRWRRMFDGRCIGTCSAARAAILMAIIPCGKCGRPSANRSITRSCRGLKRSILPAPAKCTLLATSSSPALFSIEFQTMI